MRSTRNSAPLGALLTLGLGADEGTVTLSADGGPPLAGVLTRGGIVATQQSVERALTRPPLPGRQVTDKAATSSNRHRCART